MSHKSNTVHHHVCHSFGFSSNNMIKTVNILLCSWCKVVNTTRIRYKICCTVPPMWKVNVVPLWLLVGTCFFLFPFKINEISAVPAVCQGPNTAAAASVPLVHLTHTHKKYFSHKIAANCYSYHQLYLEFFDLWFLVSVNSSIPSRYCSSHSPPVKSECFCVGLYIWNEACVLYLVLIIFLTFKIMFL